MLCGENHMGKTATETTKTNQATGDVFLSKLSQNGDGDLSEKHAHFKSTHDSSHLHLTLHVDCSHPINRNVLHRHSASTLHESFCSLKSPSPGHLNRRHIKMLATL